MCELKLLSKFNIFIRVKRRSLKIQHILTIYWSYNVTMKHMLLYVAVYAYCAVKFASAEYHTIVPQKVIEQKIPGCVAKVFTDHGVKEINLKVAELIGSPSGDDRR